jgi:hypothetical protein
VADHHFNAGAVAHHMGAQASAQGRACHDAGQVRQAGRVGRSGFALQERRRRHGDAVHARQFARHHAGRQVEAPAKGHIEAAGVSVSRRAADEKLPVSALRTNCSRLARVSIAHLQQMLETDSVRSQLALEADPA